MTMQILNYLEANCHDIYLDILQEDGGKASSHSPSRKISSALRAKMAGTNVQQRLKVKLILEATRA
jgi:hypothetical protein